VSPVETAKPIEMPFGLWTRVDPSNYVTYETKVQIPHAKGQF